MDFLTAIDILGSGLTAERVRMNVTAANLANAHTTRTPEGGPYKRRDPIFIAQQVRPRFGDLSHWRDRTRFGDLLGGMVDARLARVEVHSIPLDANPPRTVYDPTHPDANADGYVLMPNVNVIEEMVNMVAAARAYEASVAAMQSVKAMAQRALAIGK